MKGHSGSGSQVSPIAISDDEDDMDAVTGQLLPHDSSSSYLAPPTRVPEATTRKKGSKVTNQAHEKRTKIQPFGQEGNKRKRKREPNAPHSTAGPSRIPPATATSRNKRARQQERMSRWQREEASRRRMFNDTVSDSEPLHNSAPPPSMYPMELYTSPTPFSSDPQSASLDLSSLSSSDWVNSMARAADPPDLMPAPFSWEYLIPPPSWTPQPPFLTESLHSLPWPGIPVSGTSSPSLPEKPAQTPGSPSSNNPLPKKPLPTNTIGMPKNRDPEGKRGGFKLSASTVFESQPHITYPHKPDPSCSLIIDQLPKLCRSHQWLKNWSRKACGSTPAFLAIDSSTAKALLEFGSAEQAEKAWNSPKLGKGITTLSSSELKGKSREDLIRVWWYRVPSPEVVFTRKELEEGEIEDEEDMVDGRKESKKERKARLAKLEKDKKKEGAQTAVSHEQGSPASSNHLPPPQPSSAYIPMPFGTVPSSSLMSWPSSISADYVPPALPSFPLPASSHLPPQPELQTHWRDPSTAGDAFGTSSSATSPPISDVWRLLSPRNAFTGSLPGNEFAMRYAHDMSASTRAVDEFTNDMDTDDTDGDMELSSPTAHTPLSSEQTTDAAFSYHATSSDNFNFAHSVSSISAPVPVPVRVDRDMPNPDSQSLHRTLPTPTPTPSISSSRVASPDTPSEPRAMKNAPKEPSYTKRSLLARQKELEERIARSKLELERASAEMQSSTTAPLASEQQTQTPTPSSSAPISMSSSPSSVEAIPEINSNKQAMEEHLRRLVLASQKKRQKTDAAAVSPPSPAVQNDDNGSHASSVDGAVMAGPPLQIAAGGSRAPSIAVDSVLDDLAVSFIQESIQTSKSAPPASTPETRVSVSAIKPQSSSSSVGLAARREQLEYQITETKRLMGLLSLATTKQEKDSIMTQIRDISRAQEMALSTVHRTSAPAPSYPSFLVEPPRSLWPESLPSGGIFIVDLDDEDESESE